MHQWPTEDTLKKYGLLDKQIEDIKVLLNDLQKRKDSLSKEKDIEFAKLTELVDADKPDKDKIEVVQRRITELWGAILNNDVEFIMKVRELIPSKLYSKIKKLVKKGEFHKWLETLKSELPRSKERGI